ncbi:hypothetical protein niasHT_009356 [Heterodera trifolii]|uniref:Uncharacterized protein n=1 Tax=Heterodera trifolii TaxID=157864 RepID=A0ABD2M3G5_9BILA
MPVALRVSGTRANLVEPPAKIKLYSCDTYQLCSTCSSSKWPCRWCATERKCVDAEDVKRKCRNERRKGPSSACIRILPPPLGSELFVPDSTNASLQLQLDNVPSSNELLLACRFVPNSNQIRVARVAQRNTVNCEPGMFSFEGSEAMKNVTVELLADGEPVDATKMTIFKCPLLSSDCSRCVALDPRGKSVRRKAGDGERRGKSAGEVGGSDRVICLTAASPRAYTVTAIRLQIDDAVRLLPAKFEYRTDPEVRDMQPRTAYESGGRKLIVTGSHLDSVLSPKLFLLSAPTVPSASPDELELISELGACHPLNSSALSCDSPSLALPTALLRQSSMARWMVGMAMDGVRTVRNLGPIIQVSPAEGRSEGKKMPKTNGQCENGIHLQLTTVPDPQFSPFAGLHILQAEQPLMLSGQWLSYHWLRFSFSSPTDFCAVPPTVPPLPTDDSGTKMLDGRPLVVVRIGRVRVEIVPLEYAGGAISAGISRVELWSRRAGVLGLAILLIVVIVVLAAVGLAWRRRQGEHERTYRRIQLQMEQMESQVRSECKKAFAELQTDVLAELDGVDDGAGIPFLESRESVARLLLRDFAEPTINGAYGGAIYSSQLPMTLAQFESLLWNRQFIYVLVQMAEEEPTISASERASLASLLLAVLSRNLAFASDVVLSLLSAHVQRCSLMHSPHLLFRHSDSLVEKLFQQWLALCLLPHLRDSEGPARSLFLLYRALKSLTEKGPVDEVTGQARYSLSEQSLLRESVEAHPLTVLVIPLDAFDQAPVPIRTLDCDTISQLKAKLLDTLYRNVPYSTRVGIDQFDLGKMALPTSWLRFAFGRRSAAPTARRTSSTEHTRALRCVRSGTSGNASACSVQYRMRTPRTLSARADPTAAISRLVFGWRSMSRQSFVVLFVGFNPPVSELNDGHFFVGIVPISCPFSGSGASPHSSSGTDPTVHFHLQQPSGIAGGGTSNSARPSRERRSATMLSEVFLTRLAYVVAKAPRNALLTTFFESVLFTEQQQNIPVVLKYVFDFLDSEAAHCPQARHFINERTN